jgi:hypothetical protein
MPPRALLFHLQVAVHQAICVHVSQRLQQSRTDGCDYRLLKALVQEQTGDS